MNRNSNKLNVPEAKAAMDRFKMEAAREVGIDLKDGYQSLKQQPCSCRIGAGVAVYNFFMDACAFLSNIMQK